MAMTVQKMPICTLSVLKSHSPPFVETMLLMLENNATMEIKSDVLAVKLIGDIFAQIQFLA